MTNLGSEKMRNWLAKLTNGFRKKSTHNRHGFVDAEADEERNEEGTHNINDESENYISAVKINERTLDSSVSENDRSGIQQERILITGGGMNGCDNRSFSKTNRSRRGEAIEQQQLTNNKIGENRSSINRTNENNNSDNNKNNDKLQEDIRNTSITVERGNHKVHESEGEGGEKIQQKQKLEQHTNDNNGNNSNNNRDNLRNIDGHKHTSENECGNNNNDNNNNNNDNAKCKQNKSTTKTSNKTIEMLSEKRQNDELKKLSQETRPTEVEGGGRSSAQDVEQQRINADNISNNNNNNNKNNSCSESEQSFIDEYRALVDEKQQQRYQRPSSYGKSEVCHMEEALNLSTLHEHATKLSNSRGMLLKHDTLTNNNNNVLPMTPEEIEYEARMLAESQDVMTPLPSAALAGKTFACGHIEQPEISEVIRHLKLDAPRSLRLDKLTLEEKLELTRRFEMSQQQKRGAGGRKRNQQTLTQPNVDYKPSPAPPPSTPVDSLTITKVKSNTGADEDSEYDEDAVVLRRKVPPQQRSGLFARRQPRSPKLTLQLQLQQRSGSELKQAANKPRGEDVSEVGGDKIMGKYPV